jgi:hypothetical protein
MIDKWGQQRVPGWQKNSVHAMPSRMRTDHGLVSLKVPALSKDEEIDALPVDVQPVARIQNLCAKQKARRSEGPEEQHAQTRVGQQQLRDALEQCDARQHFGNVTSASLQMPRSFGIACALPEPSLENCTHGGENMARSTRLRMAPRIKRMPLSSSLKKTSARRVGA